MKFLSVCSGIEAASVAWNPIGWEAVGFSEIEPFPCAVLKHHYPSVPNFGDMTKFKEWPDATINVLCGGTPCQSFSVAGLRKGLDDPRGNLMLTFLAIAKRYRPSWVVWENVPGVLSSNGGRDFGSFLGGLAECGYGFAYRVLDAQYFGVAQRRKRVFVVGYLGDWHRAAAVLFEQHSLQGHPAPSREKGKRVAPTIDASFGRLQGCSGQDANNGHGHLIPSTSMCLNAGGQQRLDAESETLIPTIGGGFDGPVGVTLHGTDGTASVASFTDLSSSLRSRIPSGVENSTTTAVMAWSIMPQNSGRDYKARPVDVLQPLMAAGPQHGNQGGDIIQTAMQVRRLTPEECERLQGFPDDYTAIPWRKKPATECPDGPRYKALGNSWAVPVARWIGDRINKVEAWTS
jgi:DNA (cytosine-5)-methyltransferase 1